MKRKLYAKYNNRSKLIEFTFIGVNDEEAQYNYALANMKAEEENPFYNSSDYKLMCLGVIEMEGEAKNIGIRYDYAKDYPTIFGEIADGIKPKHNQAYFKNMKIKDEAKRKALEEKSGIKGE